MRKFVALMSFAIVIGCSTTPSNKTIPLNEKKIIIEYSNKILTDSLLMEIPLIKDKQFILEAKSDDNIEKKLSILSEQQIAFFFSSKEMKYYREFYNPESYFMGRMPIWNNLLPILVFNTNQSSTISLSCFFINKKGEIAGMFYPAYLDIQPNYSLQGYGKMLNDSTYELVEIGYDEVDDDSKTTKKDSSITTISIDSYGKLRKETTTFKTDTIGS